MGLGLPVGIRATDALFDRLARLSGRPVPARHQAERGRLVDAYIDGHKYLFGKRAVVFGDEDLVAGLAEFLLEIGVQPVLCATGGESGRLARAIRARTEHAFPSSPPAGPRSETTRKDQPRVFRVREDVDYLEMEEAVAGLRPDVLIGPGKGYPLARKLGVPLVRVGFPVHDRLGAARILHLGYRGTQQLFDLLVNTVIAVHQDNDPTGYLNM